MKSKQTEEQMMSYEVTYTIENYCGSGSFEERTQRHVYYVTARVRPDDVMGMLIWFYHHVGEKDVLVHSIYNEESGIEHHFSYKRDAGCRLWSFAGITAVAKCRSMSNMCEIEPCQFRKNNKYDNE